ncbi:fibrinogen-binding adhesin SdrG C-terminal domain-containing protein [Streptococcus dysgalactiae subsp. equisimilis]|uniref:SdrD B-like domain-containing protein n=1 Tax=Streptococcus dysgalactiae TaxID=1334 RepID=UPI001F13E9C2|nr:SdrD B-like domain-containing protein [Streptococcus dysgalactiae]MCL6221572.1 fibrinogen-binding adhesin SdrG C-terminal domain-containing protein [Streptococcus dysgalactiae subsp. equisimilis]UMY68874.1 fibrinogen-binding adhesin SdrG C-terminal domain-containing protein [Streptococcus dysgalactiae subsp. equisimilis]
MFQQIKSRFSVRKNKAYGICSVFLGLAILTLGTSGLTVRADEVTASPTEVLVTLPSDSQSTETGMTESPQGTAAEAVTAAEQVAPESAPTTTLAAADQPLALAEPASPLTVDESAKDISDQLQQVTVTLTSTQDNKENSSQTLNVDEPYSLTLGFSFEASAVTPGQQFHIQLSDNLTENGIELEDNRLGHLVTDDGLLVAKGLYDEKTHRLVYTFTESVNYIDRFSIEGTEPLFIDLAKVQKKNTQVHLEAALVDHKTSLSKTITYTGPVTDTKEPQNLLNLSSKITGQVQGKDQLTLTNYVNPLRKQIQSTESNPITTTITEIHPETKMENGHSVSPVTTLPKPDNIDFSTATVTIYKVTDATQLADSLVQEYTAPNFTDVTARFSDKLKKEKDKITIDWGKELADAYVVVTSLQAKPNTSGKDNVLVLDTTLEYALGNNQKYSVEFANGLLLFDSSSRGDYEKKTYTLGDFVWDDHNGDGLQNEDLATSGVPNVRLTLRDNEGKKLAETQTDASGHYQFSGLESGTYIIDMEIPSGYMSTSYKNHSAGGDYTNDSNFKDGVAIVHIGGSNRITVDAGLVKIPQRLGTVIVRHIEFGTGKELAPAEFATYDEIPEGLPKGTTVAGTGYETKPVQIEGYDLVETPEDDYGNVFEGITRLTYVYKKQVATQAEQSSIDTDSNNTTKTETEEELPTDVIDTNIPEEASQVLEPAVQPTPEVDEMPTADEKPAQEDTPDTTPEGQPIPEVEESLTAQEEPAQEDASDTVPEGQSTPEVDEMPAVDEEPAQEDVPDTTPEGQPTPEVEESSTAQEEPAQEDTPATISEGQLPFEGDEPTTKEEAVRTEEKTLPSVTDETKVLSSVKVVETSEGSSSPSSHFSEKKLPKTGETKGLRMSVLGLLLAGLGIGFMKRKKAD